MYDSEVDRVGLVLIYVYVMLDIRDVKGKKFFMLKNFWSYLRWKGNFLEKDLMNWILDLQKLLNYDFKSV